MPENIRQETATAERPLWLYLISIQHKQHFFVHDEVKEFKDQRELRVLD